MAHQNIANITELNKTKGMKWHFKDTKTNVYDITAVTSQQDDILITGNKKSPNQEPKKFIK